MERVVILIHGYNVADLMQTVGKLRQPFERLGCLVETLPYGYIPHTWQVTKRNPAIAQRLVERVRYHRSKGRTVDVVGHSNGCAIIHLAGQQLAGGEIDCAVAINPALEEYLHPCDAANIVQVWHNEGDRPVQLARWLNWLTPWADKARPWGRMGAIGYQGDAVNVFNFDTLNDFAGVVASGHSAVFKAPQSKFYLQRIAQFCQERRREP